MTSEARLQFDVVQLLEGWMRREASEARFGAALQRLAIQLVRARAIWKLRLEAIMKLYVVGMLGLALTACTPGIPIPMPGPRSSPKLASEVVNAAAVTPRDGAGAIVVIRDKTRLWRKGCTYDISLDGQLVAGLRNGEQVTLYADPGGRIVGVNIRRDNSCEPAFAQVPVQVVASATTKIRIVADVSYDLKIEATTY